MKYLKWFLAFLGIKMSESTTVPVVQGPADEKLLRIIGTVFQAMIDSKLTTAWVDAALAKVMGYITAAWPVIGPHVAGLVDPKAIIDKAFDVLAVALVSRPILAFLVLQVKGWVDYQWDKAFPAIEAKLKAKGLV